MSKRQHGKKLRPRSRVLAIRYAGDSFEKTVVVVSVMRPCMDDGGILTMGLFDFMPNPNSLRACRAVAPHSRPLPG